MWYNPDVRINSGVTMRDWTIQFLRDKAGIETVEYAVATALLIAGVLIGVGGLMLALAPLFQSVAQTVFNI